MPASVDLTARVEELESRVEELTMIQNLLLRLMSTTRPLAKLLEQYGATESQEQALYGLLDRISERTAGIQRDLVTFGFFLRGIEQIFPHRSGDRQFVQLLMDTLKLERPAYRALHDYMTANNWPIWE
jgi:hypothetical protein